MPEGYKVRSVKMPDSLWRKVLQEAKRQQRTASAQVRVCIEDFFLTPKEERVR